MEEAERPTPLQEIVEEVMLNYNYLIDEGGVHCARQSAALHRPVFDIGLKLDKARAGGSISVDSALGQGSTFCLTIPR